MWWNGLNYIALNPVHTTAHGKRLNVSAACPGRRNHMRENLIFNGANANSLIPAVFISTPPPPVYGSRMSHPPPVLLLLYNSNTFWFCRFYFVTTIMLVLWSFCFKKANSIVQPWAEDPCVCFISTMCTKTKSIQPLFTYLDVIVFFVLNELQVTGSNCFRSYLLKMYNLN